ncbi:MAG: FeoA family protein [Candidatus Omnitrophica bacterium]|nr:FeoA family protein [Candidatus Omnitrophota bacterium]MDD5774708.1 FeoA family protein [Candidatus Omnitrophota bacterium]
MRIDLTQMQPGETGVVKDILGGRGMVLKLQSMGLRPGKTITKVSSHFWAGPQTIEIHNVQIAVGFGMAKRIYIEVQR